MENTVIIGLGVFSLLLLIAIIYYAYKCDEKDRQAAIDSGIIARDQFRLESQQVEINNLVKQLETDQKIIDKNMARILNQGIDIEILNGKLEDAISLLTEERSKLKEAKECIEYYKARANHKKRPAC
jgi:hypothetical protein